MTLSSISMIGVVAVPLLWLATKVAPALLSRLKTAEKNHDPADSEAMKKLWARADRHNNAAARDDITAFSKRFWEVFPDDEGEE